MSDASESALRQINEELQALYDESAEGIIIVDPQGGRFYRVNRPICRMLGYSEEELLSLSVKDLHPAKSLPHVLELFKAMSERRLKCARDIPCLRKDGTLVYVDVTATHHDYQGRPCLFGFFHDISARKRTIELLRASEDRYRAITNNMADVIWTVDFPAEYLRRHWGKAAPAELADAVLDQWRFSFVNPAVERVFGYTPEESRCLVLGDLISPEAVARLREAMIEVFSWGDSRSADAYQKRYFEAECRAKDGSIRWCEIVSTYLLDENGVPVGMQGITRDVTERRRAERALRESESMLRVLFENIPDMILMLDLQGNIRFSNRTEAGISREEQIGLRIFDFPAPEHKEQCRRTYDLAIATGQTQTVESQDIFGVWWSCQIVPIAGENGVENLLVIATDITQERLASEAVKKEQRLLRQLLELHERERRLVSCEIHDGFAQQLTGALYRLQGFRETLGRDPSAAWQGFDAAANLLCRAIDETRRLISGLRPLVLDELGIVDAVQYLVYEHRRDGGPEIEFEHDFPEGHLSSPLENALFRIVQESLQNACRHSRSDKIRVALNRRGDHVHIEVRDWGIGFVSDDVSGKSFGLQGIRERVRLLDGSVTIESAPGEGTRLSVRLPLFGGEGETAAADE